MQLLTILWLVALAVFAIIEASCPCLLSIWFAGGALTAAIAAELGASIPVQVGLFVAVSAGMLAALRPLLRRYFNPRIQRTNAEGLIGSEAVVLSPVDNLQAQGQVKVNGMEWTARSTDGTPIPAGATVRIDRIEGVKLFVTKVED